jgi:hypothetical protein
MYELQSLLLQAQAMVTHPKPCTHNLQSPASNSPACEHCHACGFHGINCQAFVLLLVCCVRLHDCIQVHL